MARRKKEEQEPISINAPYAFVSAMNSLYVAQKLALENKDRSALIDIANSYIEMGTQLLVAGVELVYDESEDGIEESLEGKVTIGFTGGSVDGEEEAEPSEEPTENRSGPGF
jgi:hypothetical protein